MTSMHSTGRSRVGQTDSSPPCVSEQLTLFGDADMLLQLVYESEYVVDVAGVFIDRPDVLHVLLQSIAQVWEDTHQIGTSAPPR